MSSMCPCKVNDKESPLQGLSEVPSFSTWGAERKPHSRTSLLECCAHTERLHSYIKCGVGSRCHCHGQERSSSKEKERDEKKEGVWGKGGESGGQREK